MNTIQRKLATCLGGLVVGYAAPTAFDAVRSTAPSLVPTKYEHSSCMGSWPDCYCKTPDETNSLSCELTYDAGANGWVCMDTSGHACKKP